MQVLIHGVSGRMGQEVLSAICKAGDLEPVGGVDVQMSQDPLPLPDGSGSIPVFTDLDTALDVCRPQVMVDFTSAEVSVAAALRCISKDVHLVIGTTGLSPEDLKRLELLAQEYKVGVVVAPNFALGAVLLIHQARLLARYFESAEIIEAHHEAKIDAPSGTALAIARALVEGRGGPFALPMPEKEPLKGTRGGDYEGVTIHSMRMPGRLAHHTVVLGTAGQTLTLSHDTIGRECYMPGVLTAIREVVKYQGLVLGLDRLLGL